MKLVEVVIMTGVQCISPVQNTPVKTEVSKVWCAVVVEKDTVANRIEVTPPIESRNPAVRMAMQRMDAASGVASGSGSLSIEPASAPPSQRLAMPVPDAPEAVERVQPVARIEVTVPKPLPRPEESPETDPGLPQPEPEVVAAVEEPPVTEAKPAKKAVSSAKKRTDVCSGSRKAVWYTNKEGRRKYRCRRPGSTAKLY